MLFLLLIMINVNAETVCNTKDYYVGCSVESDFNCDGNIQDVTCDSSGQCNAVCVKDVSPVCRSAGCVSGETVTNRHQCGVFNVLVPPQDGKLSEEEVINAGESYCTYNWLNAYSYNYRCTNYFLLFCTNYVTDLFVSCDTPQCASQSTTVMSCQKDLKESSNCWDEQRGGCDQDGTFCYQGAVSQCDNSQQISTLRKCEESGLACAEKTSTYATCVNLNERNNASSCSSEGTLRCNPVDTNIVDTCKNGEWQAYSSCTTGCNVTGVNSGNECNNYNLDTGVCSVGNSLCLDTGNDAFLFVCVGGDWSLTKECENDRCGLNNTACWSGCEFLSTNCYASNNTCYYCNEQGIYTESGKCQGTVNNVTNQCELADTCEEGAVTCDINWRLQCSNEDWRRVEKCSYGCKLGECVTEGAGIFAPLVSIADLLVLYIPAISLLIITLGVVFIVPPLFRSAKRRMIRWSQGKQ